MPPSPDRFDRQVRFAPLGARGQARLGEASVLLVGCGALGGVLAQILTRAGIGRLRLVDRDVVELTNLPRQVLFEERHAAAGTPKVDAALESLTRIGGPTRLEARAAHLDVANIAELAEGFDLLLDGTDNLGTRYLINDYAVAHDVPWVYGGVVAAEGVVLAVLPRRGPCLRCLFPDAPPAGSLPTCDSAGVILPAVSAIASLQAGLALRILGTDPDAEPRLEPGLIQVDVWNGETRRVSIPRDEACPCCVEGNYVHLQATGAQRPVVLCGRNTVQIAGGSERPDLDLLARRLDESAQSVQRVGPLLRFDVDDFHVTVFPDGRALVEGTEDPDRARAVYDRFLGA